MTTRTRLSSVAPTMPQRGSLATLNAGTPKLWRSTKASSLVSRYVVASHVVQVVSSHSNTSRRYYDIYVTMCPLVAVRAYPVPSHQRVNLLRAVRTGDAKGGLSRESRTRCAEAWDGAKAGARLVASDW
jgi:hypothetical protein